MTDLHALAWCACTIGCRAGPCADCYQAARRILCRLTADGVVPFDATRQILDPIPTSQTTA